MKKLVECVPNFSEGRNKQILDILADVIKNVEGVTLLDIDPGFATNRTVFTFVGEPEPVAEAAFQAVKKAGEIIDMSKHTGEHARMGATDVCPFVPVSNISMDECIELSKKVGKRIGEELNIPVYLYEYSASNPERKNLANIRKGEYEGFSQKILDPQWKPDFGKPVFNPRSGCTAVGAREFLIAYNINLNSKDKKAAHDIALSIRQAGRKKRDENGKLIKNSDGKAEMVPGIFQECKAVGWYIEEYKRAQISMNLTNYNITPFHKVFDKVEELAISKGMRVTGSEIVGLIPKQAMLEAGRHYLKKQGKAISVSEDELIECAIVSCNLKELSEFDPKKKIIEYAIEDSSDSPLANMTIKDFNHELASDSPAPGGGSVAALLNALGASLSAMVGNLTFTRKNYKSVTEIMEETAIKSQQIKEEMLFAIDEDTRSFNQILSSNRLPSKTDEEISIKNKAVKEASCYAVEVPFNTLKKSLEIINLAKIVIEKGNAPSITDAGVAVLCAESGAKGALMNVLINLQTIDDIEYTQKTKKEALDLTEQIKSEARRALELVWKALEVDHV